jgi:hypothetical protein
MEISTEMILIYSNGSNKIVDMSIVEIVSSNDEDQQLVEISRDGWHQ